MPPTDSEAYNIAGCRGSSVVHGLRTSLTSAVTS